MDVTGTLVDAAMTVAAESTIRELVRAIPKRKQSVDATLVASRLTGYANNISRVKTLLSTEHAVHISEFYCAPSIAFQQSQFLPQSSDSFRYDRVLIEGVVGQGKSTLLRWLCSHSILKHGRVAIFLELRKVDHKLPLARIIQDSLQEFGLPANAEAMRHLAVAKGLEIYLDGFDELSQKDAIKVERDIDYLATHQQLARVFVTARPHAGLGNNAILTAYKILPLDSRDAYRLIDKLCADSKLANEIKGKLESHTGSVSELLETPLLVTLLVAKYVQTAHIPDNLSDFYDSIFSTLFERHDHFKTSYRRTKRLNLSTTNYEQVFRAFCFAALLADKITNDKAEAIATWALTSKGITASSTDFLDDIANTTSLLSQENGTWYFIHTSIPEFFAARHLLSLPDNELEVWASKLESSEKLNVARQVFRFADELDHYRYTKHIALPALAKLFHPLSSDETLDDASIMNWLDHHRPRLEADNIPQDSGRFLTLYFKDEGINAVRLFINSNDAALHPSVFSNLDWPAFLSMLENVSYAKKTMIKSLNERLAPEFRKFIDSSEATRDLEKRRNQSLPDLMKMLNT